MKNTLNTEFLSIESCQKGVKQIIKIEYDRLYDYYHKINDILRDASIPEEHHEKIISIETIEYFIDTLTTQQLLVLDKLVEVIIESSHLKYEINIEKRLQEAANDIISLHKE